MAHKHSVYDSDLHFAINPITRAITNMSAQKTTLIQYDHNSERFTFELPRYIEGHDMSTCNVVQIHYININPQTKEQTAGVYAVEDLQISPDADDMVILSWLISQNATQFVGSLNFLIRFACVTENVDYAWNTAIFSAISVSSGIYNAGEIEYEYADILAQWEARITALEQGGVGDDAFVSFNDYATADKAGIVKVGGDSAGVKLTADKMLVIASAGVSEINAMASANRPITPYYLQYAIKAGLSKNTLEWTEEEKASARQVLGIDDVMGSYINDIDALIGGGA